MGSCINSDSSCKVHLRVITWKDNNHGLFNYKDSVNNYKISHYILTENYYIYFDSVTRQILF